MCDSVYHLLNELNEDIDATVKNAVEASQLANPLEVDLFTVCVQHIPKGTDEKYIWHVEVNTTAPVEACVLMVTTHAIYRIESGSFQCSWRKEFSDILSIEKDEGFLFTIVFTPEGFAMMMRKVGQALQLPTSSMHRASTIDAISPRANQSNTKNLVTFTCDSAHVRDVWLLIANAARRDSFQREYESTVMTDKAEIFQAQFPLIKVNEKGKAQDRVLALSTTRFLNVSTGKKKDVKWSYTYDKLTKITVDKGMMFSLYITAGSMMKKKAAYHYQAGDQIHRLQVLKEVCRLYFESTGKQPVIENV
eukprot:GFYU01006134.1.p1 GENE.GFYU01006134.1~~GFYU01006134.1.p1  ORF type:complete len:306 (-),score=105.53 GFYU01006134.1:232-1149(-)